MGSFNYVLLALANLSGQVQGMPDAEVRGYHMSAADCEQERLRVQLLDRQGRVSLQCIKVNNNAIK